MRLLPFILGLMLLVGPGAAAGAIPSEGAAFYDSADFDRAVAAFRAQVQAQPRAAAHHYNLGNALYKSGQTGRAIASYQRAFDILPRDANIRHNLEFALRQAGEELVPTGVPSTLFRLFTVFSERELAGLHWLAAWAGLLLGGLFVYREGLRPALARWCAAALLAWALLGGWWLARLSLEPAERGVIISGSAEIRSGPGEKFSVSFTAPEGRRVQVLSEAGDWLEIGVLKEGAKGWIRADAVEKL